MTGFAGGDILNPRNHEGYRAMKCPQCGFENPSDTFYCGKCATPLPSSAPKPFFRTETLQSPASELATGSTFAGRYQIIEELGKGGMGRVYKALDTKIKEKIALKLIKPEIASDAGTTSATWRIKPWPARSCPGPTSFRREPCAFNRR